MIGSERELGIIESLGWSAVTADGVVVGESIVVATSRKSLDKLLGVLRAKGHSYREIGGRFSEREASLDGEVVGAVLVDAKLPNQPPERWCFTGDFVRANGGEVPGMFSYGSSSETLS